MARIADALRIAEPAAREHLAALNAAGLVRTGEPEQPSTGDAAKPVHLIGPEQAERGAGLAVVATEAGLRLWRAVRADTTRLTATLWGDVPEDDRAAAARVLNTVLERAGAALAAN